MTLCAYEQQLVRECLDAIEVGDTGRAEASLESAFDWEATGELEYWCEAHDALLAGRVPDDLVERLKALLT